MPLAGSARQYGLGFVLATAALHGLGLGLGKSLQQRAWWLRGAGVMLAAGGAWLMV